MHQGIMRGADVNLTDRTYDGFFENGRLFGGLGQLTDGQKGEDNFRDDPHGYGKGKSEIIQVCVEKIDVNWNLSEPITQSISKDNYYRMNMFENKFDVKLINMYES